MIIGKKYEKRLKNAINAYNINVICADNNEYIDERLSGHVDLSMLHLGEGKIAAAEFLKNSELFNKMEALGFEAVFYPNPISAEYPDDVRLNICIVDDFVICNPKTAESELLEQKTMIRCNQGYTKCSVAVVDEKSIITSDRIIAENAALYGIDALPIDDSFVKLRGFNKGFIGGAAFKISKDKIAFTGIINDTVKKNVIERYLSKRGIEAVYLTNEPIFDIGGAIPIIEEI